MKKIIYQSKHYLCIFLSICILNVTAFANDTKEIAAKSKKEYRFTILHTNDHHGRFWENNKGEGGLAAQKTLIDSIRKEVNSNGGKVILLSAGDVNTGVPESDMLNAEPDFKAMDMIGYDAMAIGNHEFDKDLAMLQKQQSWVKFPFLSSNIYYKNSNKRVFTPYKIIHVDDLKIAVFGLTTEDTYHLTSPINTQDVTFVPAVDEAKKIVNEIKKAQNPDVMIALTHIGHYPNADHGSIAPGDVSLAKAFKKSEIDIIVGGHTHNSVCMSSKNKRIEKYIPGMTCEPDVQNGTWIIQANEWSKFVGRADYVYKNGKLKLERYLLIPINLKRELKKEDGTKEMFFYTKEIPQDEKLLAFLKEYQNKGEQALLQKVGELKGRLEGDRSVVRFQQSNMGQLLLSAFVEKTNADIGIMTGGMIRDSISEGDVTYRDILKVEPFGNTVAVFELSGAQLFDYVQVAVKKKLGSGSFGHFKNLNIVLNEENKVTSIKHKSIEIDFSKTYKIATLEFLAAGGDGYPKVNHLPTYVDTGYLDADTIKEYFLKHSPIKAVDYEPSDVVTILK